MLRARRGVGGIRGHLGAPRGLGVLGIIRGCRGIRGRRGVRDWGGKWIGSPTTLSPSPGSQHSHWFPLGSDLPGQAKQVTKMSSAGYYIHLELYFVSLHICIYATSSHILTHNVKKCYTDYFLCRPIYASPYTINLMY